LAGTADRGYLPPMEERSRLQREHSAPGHERLPPPARGAGTTNSGTQRTVRYTIGFKIFAIAAALLTLMAGATLLMVRMSRDVDKELEFFASTYLPSYAAIARANVRSVERALILRRLVIVSTDGTAAPEHRQALREQFAELGRQSEKELALARARLAERLDRKGGFDDVVAVTRLDTRLGQASEEHRRRYEVLASKFLEALDQRDAARYRPLLATLDELRDDFDQTLDGARRDMLQIVTQAAAETSRRQQRVVWVSVLVTVIAGVLGLGFAALVANGLVRPVRRLLDGTKAVREGQLDALIPVTSRDEIGRLTEEFNHMIGELRVKARIRDTFGRYVDPRIVEGLIDRPELAGISGERRMMTVLFCDMQGFTSLSERMTPSGMVTVLNEYLSVMSKGVREHDGIIDKYIGDAVMAFWGPPFNAPEEQSRLACLAALAQLGRLALFRQALPELIGIRRGLPDVDVRIGIATGDVVVGNIGSEVTKSYTVMGATVNVASRLQAVNKIYGTHILINEATAAKVEGAIEVREIDTIVVSGTSESQRVFEVLGRAGGLDPSTAKLRDRFGAGLAAYRRRDWAAARTEFEGGLAVVPGDGASRVLLARVAHFAERPPGPDWDGVWTAPEK
jgi:class 3 adenylate cyclase